MHFQSQLGQTKDVFDNLGKNTTQGITFLLGKFQLKLKTHASKKLKWNVATRLKRQSDEVTNVVDYNTTNCPFLSKLRLAT